MLDKLEPQELDSLLGSCRSVADVESMYAQLMQQIVDRVRAADAAARFRVESPSTRERRLRARSAVVSGRVLALHAGGMRAIEIRDTLSAVHGMEVTQELIDEVIAVVAEEFRVWRERPLEPIYPVLWIDGIQLDLRVGQRVVNHAVHVAVGIDPAGSRTVLGLSIAPGDAALSQPGFIASLARRGVRDIYVLCADHRTRIDGLAPANFEQTLVLPSVAHLLRNSTRLVARRHCRSVTTALKRIHGCATPADADRELDAFEHQWGDCYATVVRTWREAREPMQACFDLAPEIRRITQTTCAIDALNATMLKYARRREQFPDIDSTQEVMYLAIRAATHRWRGVHHWRAALQAFPRQFGAARMVARL